MVTAVRHPLSGQDLVETYERLDDRGRFALAQFAAFLAQQEAEIEEDLIMADAELAQSIREGNRRFQLRDFDACPLLEDAFPDDV